MMKVIKFNLSVKRLFEEQHAGPKPVVSLPDGWTLKKIKFLFKEKNHRSLTGKETLLSLSKYHGLIPRHQLTDKVESANSLVDYKICSVGDLVINKLQAWNGMLDISRYQGIISPDYSVYVPIEKEIDLRYFKYLFQTQSYIDEFAKRSSGIGDGFFRLYTESFYDIYSICPSFETQTCIAQFLDRKTAQIDQAIAKKEKLTELLKERRQVLIQNAVTRGLNPNVKMKDSGVEWIGKVPKHWNLEKVKRIFRLIIDPAPVNNSYQLLSLYTEIGVKPRAELEERGNRASTTDNYWKVRKGDIIVNKLLAWMGAVGMSNYDGVTSPAYDILRAIREVSGNYFHYLFRTPLCSSELRKHSKGIMDMRLRLYFDKFGDVLVPLPPRNEQESISNWITDLELKIDEAINFQKKSISRLEEYKATLINSAVTGKIKVTNESLG